MEDTQIMVLFPGGKRVQAEIGGAIVSTDQEKDQGGLGEDPTPFQLLLAALATCAGHYVMSFCERRKLSAEGLALSMDCRTDAKGKRMEAVSFDVVLPEDFPEKFAKAVSRVVDACAVKQFIADPPAFETTVRRSKSEAL